MFAMLDIIRIIQFEEWLFAFSDWDSSSELNNILLCSINVYLAMKKFLQLKCVIFRAWFITTKIIYVENQKRINVFCLIICYNYVFFHSPHRQFYFKFKFYDLVFNFWFLKNLSLVSFFLIIVRRNLTNFYYT